MPTFLKIPSICCFVLVLLENVKILMAKTQQEQAEVQARIDATKKSLNDEAQIAYDTQQWKEAISQYADIQELDAATLNRLVKAIIVHEKIDDGERHITIEIHFNLQPMPEIQRLESASYASMKKRSCSF